MSRIIVPVLYSDSRGYSIFTEQSYELEEYNGLFISPRVESLNFRHRVSEPGYYSSWHIAGDPTLILIRQGKLRIGLRDKSYRDFIAGDMFIAKDKVSGAGEFDEQVHGHTAQLIGEENLLAVHIKLASV